MRPLLNSDKSIIIDRPRSFLFAFIILVYSNKYNIRNDEK